MRDAHPSSGGKHIARTARTVALEFDLVEVEDLHLGDDEAGNEVEEADCGCAERDERERRSGRQQVRPLVVPSEGGLAGGRRHSSELRRVRYRSWTKSTRRRAALTDVHDRLEGGENPAVQQRGVRFSCGAV